MALITEDGSGMSDSESFVSAADADAYLAARGFTLWATLSESEKEQSLRRATDYMEQVYRNRWAGYRVVTTQALSWPRDGVPVQDGYYPDAEWPADEVPVIVANACAAMAYKAASGDLSPDIERLVQREKIGPLETEYVAGAPAYKRYRSIDQMLGPLLKYGGGSTIPVVRA